ncbi:DUF4097 family beta strand repeat-containing protein [Bacillus sp. REN16]|uniref:DUF4097 family beta strand repeat-containing protein n=1 Tax=Bacillus sp. REN16 TaxID=2887296 RepID=UPI001E55FCC3|nr:DUF4097 family beta strand repeat-containing protein [Bacillus sp. REN16]MCC3359390.1 DUF4097 domain-containing protein [Bacillus sp. REN16]
MIKKLSLLALLVFFIGVIGSVVTYGSMNNKVSINEKKLIENENITSIQIDVDSTDVEFITVRSMDEARVELVGKSVENTINDFSVKEEGETLSISLQPENSKWFNFKLYLPTLKLKIFAPEKMYNNVYVNGSSSDVNWQSLKAKSIEISTVSGDVHAESTHSEKMTVKTVSGDVYMERIQGEIETVTVSGDVFISTSELSHSIYGKTTSGDIDIESVKEPTDIKFEVSTSSGDVNLFDKYNNNAKMGKGDVLIQLKTDSGDITATNK